MQCSRDRPVPRRLFYLKPQHFSPSPTARICRRQRWRSAVNTSRRLHGRTTRRHRRGVSFAIKLHSRSDTAEKHAPQVTLRVLRRNTTSHARADAATAAVTATVTRTQTRLQLTSKKKKKKPGRSPLPRLPRPRRAFSCEAIRPNMDEQTRCTRAAVSCLSAHSF